MSASVRTVDQVKAEIDAAKVSAKVLEYTNGCRAFEKDLAQFRRSCQPLLQLRSQMADAQRKAELEAKVPYLKAAADALKPTEQAAAAETGVSQAWGWIMGFAVVFVATFGPVIFARPEASEVSPPGSEALEPFDHTDVQLLFRGGREREPLRRAEVSEPSEPWWVRWQSAGRVADTAEVSRFVEESEPSPYPG